VIQAIVAQVPTYSFGAQLEWTPADGAMKVGSEVPEHRLFPARETILSMAIITGQNLLRFTLKILRARRSCVVGGDHRSGGSDAT
jgi:hypothetical protein